MRQFYLFWKNITTDHICNLIVYLVKLPMYTEIINSIISGKTIYESLYIYSDKTGIMLLNCKNIYGLREFGNYMLLKSEIRQKMISSLLYPLTVLLISSIILLVMKYVFNDSINMTGKIQYLIYIYVFIIFIIGSAFYNIYRNIQKYLYYIFFTYLIENYISFEMFVDLMSKKIHIDSIKNINDISMFYFRKPFISLNLLKQDTKMIYNDNNNLIKLTNTIIIILILLINGVIILYYLININIKGVH